MRGEREGKRKHRLKKKRERNEKELEEEERGGRRREGERERENERKFFFSQESGSANRASWGGGRVIMEGHDKRECGGNSKGTQLTWP